VAKESIRKGA